MAATLRNVNKGEGKIMGKMIQVELIGIFCDFSDTDPDNDLEIFGSFWGTTFNDDLIETERTVIFSFPDGPIRIAPGQMVRINKNARFALSTPETEGTAGPFKTFLKFGGELFEKDVPPDADDPLGSSFKTVSNLDNISPDHPQKHRLRFGNIDQEVRADFLLTFAHPL